MGLSDYFRKSAYALHRSALRKQRLPGCCQEKLSPTGRGVRFLTRGGCDTVLPLWKCRVCTRTYAMMEERYLPIDNPLRFEIVER
ncbi:MAG: hypothetical protein IIZ68_03345 [Clostridia bacterium]|nr:hypothetical protein [Clostridia bacterium]